MWKKRTLEDDNFEAFFSYEGAGGREEEGEPKETAGEYRGHFQGASYRPGARRPRSTGSIYGRAKITREREAAGDSNGDHSRDRDAEEKEESQEKEEEKKQTPGGMETRRTTYDTPTGSSCVRDQALDDREQRAETGEQELSTGTADGGLEDDSPPSLAGRDTWGCNRRGPRFRSGRAPLVHRGGRAGLLKPHPQCFARRCTGQAHVDNGSDFADGEGEEETRDKGMEKEEERDEGRESHEQGEAEEPLQGGRLFPASAGSSAPLSKSGSWNDRETGTRPKAEGSTEGGAKVKGGGRGGGEGYAERDESDGSRISKRRCVGRQTTPSNSEGEEEHVNISKKGEGEETKITPGVDGGSEEQAAVAEKLRPWPRGDFKVLFFRCMPICWQCRAQNPADIPSQEDGLGRILQFLTFFSMASLLYERVQQSVAQTPSARSVFRGELCVFLLVGRGQLKKLSQLLSGRTRHSVERKHLRHFFSTRQAAPQACSRGLSCFYCSGFA